MAEPVSWEEAVAAGAYQGLDLERIAAEHGTPSYVYAAEMIDAACARVFDAAAPLDARLRYAMKANANLSVIRRIREAGFGFDIASALEQERAMRAGAPPGEIIYTGPGKSRREIAGFISAGGEEIICDSPAELDRIARLADEQQAEGLRVGVRVNPDVDAGGHPHIATGYRGSKFGVEAETAAEMLHSIEAEHPRLLPGSLSCHIGSQVLEIEAYQAAYGVLEGLADELAGRGVALGRIDLGGGFAIGDSRKRPETDVFTDLCGWLAERSERRALGFQPGRSLVGRAGILLTRVEYVKERHIIVDAAMTELLRPALYQGVHGIAKVGSGPCGPGEMSVVGPVCESADWIAKGCDLEVKQGDLLAVFDAGAYASAMMSGYNGRLRAAEIMVSAEGESVARRRETVAEALSFEG